MPSSKLALKPAEGVYYAVPSKEGGYRIFSQRSDEVDDPLHMMYWEKVLREIANEYKLDRSDIQKLNTAYMAVPRGRVQKEFDKATLKETGRYLIIHGGDAPLSQIKHFVLQDFGLLPLSTHKKVDWKVDTHEKMDPEDKKLFEEITHG